MNRIEEAFKANDQTGKEKSKVCRITIRIARQEITYLIYMIQFVSYNKTLISGDISRG